MKSIFHVESIHSNIPNSHLLPKAFILTLVLTWWLVIINPARRIKLNETAGNISGLIFILSNKDDLACD